MKEFLGFLAGMAILSAIGPALALVALAIGSTANAATMVFFIIVIVIAAVCSL